MRVKDQLLGSWAPHSSSGSCQAVKIEPYCTSDFYKEIILILSRLSDSVQGRRGSYFQAQALYLGLRTS